MFLYFDVSRNLYWIDLIIFIKFIHSIATLVLIFDGHFYVWYVNACAYNVMTTYNIVGSISNSPLPRARSGHYRI